jgi:hypothetical protein
MSTDGGGWTVVSAQTGVDGEVTVTSPNEVDGNPLLFQAYNLNTWKKAKLASKSHESMIMKKNGQWLKLNTALFQANTLLTANSRAEWLATASVQSGNTTLVKVGYTTDPALVSGGGDYGIAISPPGLDHHSNTYYELNGGCANMLLYSYSAAARDEDAGYDVNTGLGSWTSTSACEGGEGGTVAIRWMMREIIPQKIYDPCENVTCLKSNSSCIQYYCNAARGAFCEKQINVGSFCGGYGRCQSNGACTTNAKCRCQPGFTSDENTCGLPACTVLSAPNTPMSSFNDANFSPDVEFGAGNWTGNSTHIWTTNFQWLCSVTYSS